VSPWDNDDLLREERFSIERLEEHARSLAVAQQVTPQPKPRPSLAARLADNDGALLACYRAIAAAARDGQAATPAAEWLLDNFHVVEIQIREIREDLPPGFYRELPKLKEGPLEGYPRVLGIAWAFVAHTDSHFEYEALRRFVQAYQRVQPLTIGELWAVAITVRIVLIENLRRAAQRIVTSRAARHRADTLADRLLGVNGAAPDPEALGRGDGFSTLAAPFVVQLVQRLRDQDPQVTPALLWLEKRLSAQGTTSEAVVREEHARQGGSNVTVRNVITSMRLIADTDWAKFVESVSLVDEALRAGSNFAAMDFASRNLYRTAVEDLSRGSKRTERQIADMAVAAAGDASGARRRDPGYHLIAAGRPAFEAQIGYRARISRWPRRLVLRLGPAAYIGAVGLTTVAALCLGLQAVDTRQIGGWTLLSLAILGCIPAIDVAVALVNRAVARGFGATLLPGLALRDGIPRELRTLVVVPTLLTSLQAIAAQIERLEVHYLASGGGELYFAMLSDWEDAPAEHLAGDESLRRAADLGIARLNARYAQGGTNARFFLLHRRRVWSGVQRCWMGWERKRGKLHELNRLLRGATDTSFASEDWQAPIVPADVKFVITLDTDTRLPRGAARRLVGKLAHPLNSPRFDAAVGRVVEGYAVLQPRVTPSLPQSREGSLLQRIVSAAPGLDPYASAVSDVYQDLFGEGSYAGKGIYDVDAFEAALGNRVPDGSLLSHDLFEGIFARAGLASDIEVVEEFPARYDVAAARQHRWARGDWQLLPWLLGRRDAAPAQRGHRRLPLIGIWKMIDNLRRTVSAPVIFAALLVGWTLPLRAAMLWSGFLLATIVVPTLLPIAAEILPRRRDVSTRSHARALLADLWLAVRQAAFQIVFLPHQAWLMIDAIGRTLFRLLVSHRDLLEWTTAAQSAQRKRLDVVGAYCSMRGALFAVAVAAAVALTHAGRSSSLAAPFILLWCACPAAAYWISRPSRLASREAIDPADAQAYRLIARRTWRYFETFVTADEHMLPPDNFQEDPLPRIAHRTSPTNLGLCLLSTVSARDFGWIGTAEALVRLEATLATMERLQRCHGHFYNWYDTQDLRPLEPRYVSAVDSGNLAAHLMTLASAAKEWGLAPSMPAPAAAAGIGDALCLARDARRALGAGLNATQGASPQMDAAFDALAADLLAASNDTAHFVGHLQAAAARAATLAALAAVVSVDVPGDVPEDLCFWIEAVRRSIDSALSDLLPARQGEHEILERLAAMQTKVRAMAAAMDFDFLFDRERRLLSIGYLVEDGTLDPSCYDLLASEARLASFIAIAKGDVPARHWYRLGRQVTTVSGGSALLSWSGSMFEYLMPELVMRAPWGSLLERTHRLIVGRQISYGAALGVPWGISESAYNARDLELTYQYSNFGVPGLGLKRGLGENLVVAPYATALAAMVDPRGAIRNYERLAATGALGRYGFDEALDYTPSRLPENTRFALVRAFMAHHQGMTIVAILNVLTDGLMRKRFHAEPIVKATDLLLQERTPREVAVFRPSADEARTAADSEDPWYPAGRRLRSANEPVPQVNLLSNGRYSIMVTSAGSGYSRWRTLAVTRWREDLTCDDTGSYLYLRDPESGAVWSAAYQPCAAESEDYTVHFTEDRAEYVQNASEFNTTMTIVVSPEDDAEVRRLTITNTGNRTRDIEITSYAELVLAPPAADTAHPAFSKLFIQTEYVAALGVLIATRRRRSPDEAQVWAAHQAVVEGEIVGEPEIETDRARFVGRGRELRMPLAMAGGRRLSNTAGTVLDGIFALRYRLRIAAGATARIAYWTMLAASREAIFGMIDKHHDANAFVRASTLAWTQSQVQLRHLAVTAAEANLFQRLAGHLLFADATLRSPAQVIRRGSGARSGLWSQGISGDLPIVLLKIDDLDDVAIVRQLLRAHEYWRMKQLAVDLVILNDRAASYVHDLQAAIEAAVRTGQSRLPVAADAAAGRVFVLRADVIGQQARALLNSVARVVLVKRRRSVAEQLDSPVEPVPQPARRATRGDSPPRVHADEEPPALEFFNGLGGFAANGSEYVTLLGPGKSTPTPWINVIANPNFGFQVAAEGSGFTWAVNSRENTLTPWSNDPIADRCGEAIYLRDEQSGEFWSATAAPTHDPQAFHEARHGQGYSRFRHASHQIDHDLLMFVPLEDPVKISRLRIRNTAAVARRISVTVYVEWVLGTSRAAEAPFILTDVDGQSGALLARNPWSVDFGSRVAFVDLCGRQSEWTADRREFLGRNGALAQPAALTASARLSGRVGAGLDPCAALRAFVDLGPAETADIVILLGQAADGAQARALLQFYRAVDVEAALRDVVAYWAEALGAVQVRTPDRALDIMLNRWLLYQTQACRLWARTAFYQASGAYGFRDQLQDVMALTVSRPALSRAHLLRAAGRQFSEGDVQHWWLPPSGRGVRTRIADDRVWLAFATAHYADVTADTSVLDEIVPFIDGPALLPGEQDAFFQPGISDLSANLFEHCALALDDSLAVGVHGLPLFGTGDWNDGMNRVGELGRGESIWLGWFLQATLAAFAPLAAARGDTARAALWLAHAAALRGALDRDGWDGGWYRRGYFDDGTPLGSSGSEECRIDSIAQSWSVICGGGDPERARRAMKAVRDRLILRDEGLALLFTPPFDRTPLDPGYIKGYPPGIRENGGQYTHAAAWSVIALAELGRAEEAHALYAMLNPINHSTTRTAVQRYKVEPYVAAADVYSVAPHSGRGGWTWYTGSAGWMYRAGLEFLLGFRLHGNRLTLKPCIPESWPGFSITFQFRSSRYRIRVDNPRNCADRAAAAHLDGAPLVIGANTGAGVTSIDLLDDGRTHELALVLGAR